MVLMEKKLTKEEVKCYKMTERGFFKTFYDYDEDSLNTKSIKLFLLKTLSRQILLKIVKVKKKKEV